MSTDHRVIQLNDPELAAASILSDDTDLHSTDMGDDVEQNIEEGGVLQATAGRAPQPSAAGPISMKEVTLKSPRQDPRELVPDDEDPKTCCPIRCWILAAVLMTLVNVGFAVANFALFHRTVAVCDCAADVDAAMAALLLTPVPTAFPTTGPTEGTQVPTGLPTEVPTGLPTTVPTEIPTEVPTGFPTEIPTGFPTTVPTGFPTEIPSGLPTTVPTEAPTDVPSGLPTTVPTEAPTDVPTGLPTTVPTEAPTGLPTLPPTDTPTEVPTATPTPAPTNTPCLMPSNYAAGYRSALSPYPFSCAHGATCSWIAHPYPDYECTNTAQVCNNGVIAPPTCLRKCVISSIPNLGTWMNTLSGQDTYVLEGEDAYYYPSNLYACSHLDDYGIVAATCNSSGTFDHASGFTCKSVSKKGGSTSGKCAYCQGSNCINDYWKRPGVSTSAKSASWQNRQCKTDAVAYGARAYAYNTPWGTPSPPGPSTAETSQTYLPAAHRHWVTIRPMATHTSWAIPTMATGGLCLRYPPPTWSATRSMTTTPCTGDRLHTTRPLNRD